MVLDVLFFVIDDLSLLVLSLNSFVSLSSQFFLPVLRLQGTLWLGMRLGSLIVLSLNTLISLLSQYFLSILGLYWTLAISWGILLYIHICNILSVLLS